MNGQDSIGNALATFSATSAYENIDKVVVLYTFPALPSLDDDEGEDENNAVYQKNPTEFQKHALVRYAFARDNKDKKRIHWYFEETT